MLARAAAVTWTAVVIASTASAFAWEASHIKRALPFLLILATAYLLLRRFWWQWELVGLIAIPTIGALVYEPRAALLVLSLTLSAVVAGKRIVASLNPPWIVAGGVGLGALHLLLFLLGLAHLLNTWIALVLIVAPLVLFRHDAKTLARDCVALHQRWSTSTLR